MKKTGSSDLNTVLKTLLASATLGTLAIAPAAHADTQTRTTSYEYDAAGLLSKTIVEPSRPNDCLQAVYSRDSFGNATTSTRSTCAGALAPATTSAGSRSSSDNYGTDGRFVLSSTNAAAQSETKTYDPRNGRLLSLTGPNGLTTSWQYDNFGRKTRESRVDTTYTTWSYLLCTDTGANCPGAIAGAASVWAAIEQSFAVNGAANASQRRTYFDALNRVVRTQTQGFDGGGAAPVLVQDIEYNALGQISRKSDIYALSGGSPIWSSFSYDVLGRVVGQTTPDPASPGGIATSTFDYNALITTLTNAKGQTKTTTKNARGQIASVVDAQGSSISYSYDAQGNLLSTNAAGSITTMGYDIRGNKTSMLDPAMGAWTYSYNAYGELVAQRDSLNQSVSIAYDNLGRMTQRTEPDLVSQWSYDTKFDGSACGKGVGKLCEAKADNGYKRVHSYDTLGRQAQTATVLDDPANPAVVSESFDANTGRITSKTWPTGYQASYSYTPLGYLNTVTGGGTNGFTQTVSYQVQAMNAQGQITQYRTGNTVTVVNTFDSQTQRLNAILATADGKSSGNVLKQNYAYDSLGNLTTRSDTSPNVGTQESYSYDSLNRLTTATLLGGAVSPPTTTEVQYDARGNIVYKSDVGRYWYDSARPNRMTAVTLETATGAIQSVTGTRTLSYAFDDLKSGAQMVNGTQVGNGNLEYTVSHDTTNNVHTVRAESYTSFNLPNVITYRLMLGVITLL
jgi:YD repeat-containing protein